MVLRAASEIDEKEGPEGSGGLSVSDLEEIAREVGISPEAISKAVERLDRKRERTPRFGGAPAVHKAVHAVRGELNEEALGQLIRVVDDETDSAGAISEALGSVRWTTGDRFHSTQVSLTPENGETVIQVVEKVQPRLRRVSQLMPAAWGLMFSGGMIGAMDLNALGTSIGLAAGVLLGGGLGRIVWNRLSARSGERVERLAAALSRHAYEASKKGLVVPPEEPES